MEETGSPRLRYLWVALGLMGIVILFTGTYCGNDQTNQVRRVDPQVWAGYRYQDGPPSLDTEDWYPLDPGDVIETDDLGQAELTLLGCSGSLWIFGGANLERHPCKREPHDSGTFICLEEGDMGWAQYCGSRLDLATPSCAVVVSGTAFTLSYLPAEELSLVTVLSGTVVVTPVLDIKTSTLAKEAIALSAGQFVYTMPDDKLESLANLRARTALPVPVLPFLLEKLSLQLRFDNLTFWGQQKKILPPVWPIKIDVGLQYEGGPLKQDGIEEALLMAIDFREVVAADLPDMDIAFTVTTLDKTRLDAYLLPHDPEKSKQLLLDGGYARGFDIQVVYPAGDRLLARMAVRIAQQLAEVGLSGRARAVVADQMDAYLSKVASSDAVTLWLVR